MLCLSGIAKITGDDKIVVGPQAALLICETTRRPWGEDHFRHVFAEIRSAAAAEWGTFFLDDDTTVAMRDLWFMHLRHTAVTELAIAGCTTLEVAGISGHTPKSVETILNRYLVRTSRLAAVAAGKRLERGDEIAALVDVEAPSAPDASQAGQEGKA